MVEGFVPDSLDVRGYVPTPGTHAIRLLKLLQDVLATMFVCRVCTW